MGRRRTLVIVATVLALMLVAVVAVAVFLSMKETATSTFSAHAIGEVDIGDAETTPLFDLSGMEPGDSQSACFNAQVDTTGVATGDWRLYSGGVSGDGLQDYLLVTIDLTTPSSFLATPGIFDCASFVSSSQPVSAEVLSSYGTSTPIYAAGDSLGAQYSSGTTTVGIKVTIQLPNTPTVQANASGLGAETRWVVENQ